MALTTINYGYKNLQYDSNVGKLTWVNNLYVLGQGELESISASTVVYRDDIAGGLEAVNETGVPLPLDTVLVANIIASGSILGVEYHVYPVATVPTESDTNIYVAWNRAGEVMNKYSQPWNYETSIYNESKAYTDNRRRTDQEIIDLVTDAGVAISDYQTAFTERIEAIIDKAMGSKQIQDAIDKMKASWDKMQLTGDDRARLEAEFMNNLTSGVIQNAIQTGATSMLTQQQAELAKRQKLGFDDNLLVKAGEQQGNTIALINSGSSNATPANWTDFQSIINELVARSKGE